MSNTPADIAVTQHGAATIVMLGRVKALNALTVAMREAIASALRRASRDPDTYAVILRSESPRAFSAGSDVREVIGLARKDKTLGAKAFADEYALNWHCECFSKPTLSLIDGMVMGGGVGISLWGTHRIAAENYSFAMPETMIGLFPDVGVCHALARMPGGVGAYLGLTGRSIGRADALALGLATHAISRDRFREIVDLVAEAWPVDTVLDERREEAGASVLDPHREVIDRCFTGKSVPEILARLDAVQGVDAVFARDCAADLRKRSPISLAMTLRHIRESAGRDLKATLEADYRLAVCCLDGHDFYEGARAALIDKDGAPRWQPASIDLVTEAMVEAYFAPLGSGELVLPGRGEMQAARI